MHTGRREYIAIETGKSIWPKTIDQKMIPSDTLV
jgi:hypothetical protein